MRIPRAFHRRMPQWVVGVGNREPSSSLLPHSGEGALHASHGASLLQPNGANIVRVTLCMKSDAPGNSWRERDTGPAPANLDDRCRPPPSLVSQRSRQRVGHSTQRATRRARSRSRTSPSGRRTGMVRSASASTSRCALHRAARDRTVPVSTLSTCRARTRAICPSADLQTARCRQLRPGGSSDRTLDQGQPSARLSGPPVALAAGVRAEPRRRALGRVGEPALIALAVGHGGPSLASGTFENPRGEKWELRAGPTSCCPPRKVEVSQRVT